MHRCIILRIYRRDFAKPLCRGTGKQNLVDAKLNLALHITGGTEDEDDDEDSLEEDTPLNDAVLEIAEALNSSKIRRAVKLLECALEMFHGAEVFG